MSKNKIAVAVLLLAFALFGANAQASVAFDTDKPAIAAQTQALPAFMQDLNAVPMKRGQMKRGQEPFRDEKDEKGSEVNGVR